MKRCATDRVVRDAINKVLAAKLGFTITGKVTPEMRLKYYELTAKFKNNKHLNIRL
mgnify:CR=1 FL=1